MTCRGNIYFCGMKARKNVQRKLGVLLIAIFMGYFASTNFFPHTHTVEGRLVAHSHPYLPSAHHTHSASAVDCIAYLSVLLLILVAATPLFLFSFKLCGHYSFVEQIPEKYFVSDCLLRGPPRQ